MEMAKPKGTQRSFDYLALLDETTFEPSNWLRFAEDRDWIEVKGTHPLNE